ncbi:MAG: 50S ribosomal protein L1 [Desulfurococcaceae archaeon]
MPEYTKQMLVEAISKAIQLGGNKRNFKQSVEMIIILRDLDIKSQAGKIRESVLLPKGRGKDLKICVVTEGEAVEEIKAAGALMVLTPNDLQNMNKKQAKKIAASCDWLLVKQSLMGLVGRVLGPALGPRGKIPMPLPPSANLKALINRYKNTILVRIKDQPQISVSIGTEDMSAEDLAENALAVLSTLRTRLPSGEANINHIVFKTTMGTPVEV